MFLDWLLKTEEDKISYDELKMLAQFSEDGNLLYGQNTTAATVSYCKHLRLTLCINKLTMMIIIFINVGE